MGLSTTLLNLYRQVRTAEDYTLVTLWMAGAEYILTSLVFSCPCLSYNWNLCYSLTFLLVSVLLVPNFVQRACLGLQGTDGGVSSEAPTRCRDKCYFACAIVSIWVVVVLLDSEIYECLASGVEFWTQYMCDNNTSCVEQMPLVPCKQANISNGPKLLRSLRAQSQVLGFILTAIIFSSVLMYNCCWRCEFPACLKQQEIYRGPEQKIFKREAENPSNKLATKKTDCLLEDLDLKEYTAQGKALQWNSSPNAFNLEDQCQNV